jgi:hypothetical protein
VRQGGGEFELGNLSECEELVGPTKGYARQYENSRFVGVTVIKTRSWDTTDTSLSGERFYSE